MRQVNSLNHTRWECKYHIVFIPKYRRKTLFGQIRRELREIFHRLARQKESLIEEGHVMPDHVHMMISIPPKYAVAQVVGYWEYANRAGTTGRFNTGDCITSDQANFRGTNPATGCPPASIASRPCRSPASR